MPEPAALPPTRRGAGRAYLVGRSVYEVGWERYSLRVTEWQIPLPRLPADLDGLRLVHLSDLHLGPEIPFDYLTGRSLWPGSWVARRCC